SAAATAWITDAVANPATEKTAAVRPWPRQRDRINKIAGPGVRLSAKADTMNRAIVRKLGMPQGLLGRPDLISARAGPARTIVASSLFHNAKGSPMQIERLDHLVLTVADIDRTCAFYQRVLGMEVVRFGEGRTALRFGQQKINLHPAGNVPGLVADKPTPGSGDLCFISETPLAEVVAHLQQCGVPIIAGPGPRAGAIGTIQSVYIRDPDQNLVEISSY